jgi:uncharacterized protein YlxW (UPF0749 family)
MKSVLRDPGAVIMFVVIIGVSMVVGMLGFQVIDVYRERNVLVDTLKQAQDDMDTYREFSRNERRLMLDEVHALQEQVRTLTNRALELERLVGRLEEQVDALKRQVEELGGVPVLPTGVQQEVTLTDP